MGGAIHKKNSRKPGSKTGAKPCALTIAGSDSGGGAGIQADLKTFARLGVHGTSAITAITAQNPDGVRGVEAISSRLIEQQMEAVFDAFSPVAVKTGMLYSREIITTIARVLAGREVMLVVDPVMIATSGGRLLRSDAVESLKRELFPKAAIITPNLPETEALLERAVATPEEMREAARDLHARFGCAVLVKGGHMKGSAQAVDFFSDGETELLLTGPYVRAGKLHGTGCTYSAALAAYLARGSTLPKAALQAKEFTAGAIADRENVRGYAVLKVI